MKFITSSILAIFIYSDVAYAMKTLRFCITVEKIDYNPFREIKDGKELAYLTLLKSYISTLDNVDGILSKFEFSADGKLFTAQVAESARWPDGTRVSAKEAAYSIAKALKFRPLGKRISVLGTDDINKKNWQNRSYKGIELIDQRTFRLHLSSSIENINGVFREALSTSSRHNRMWPVRFSNKESSSPEVLGKFDIIQKNGFYEVHAHGHNVQIVPLSGCIDADFGINVGDFKSPESNYNSRKGPHPSSIWIQINTVRLSKQAASKLNLWLKEAFNSHGSKFGFSPTQSFYLKGEPGYSDSLPKAKPSSTPIEDIAYLRSRSWRIAYEIPWYSDVIKSHAQNTKVDILLEPFPFKRSDVDAQILSSHIKGGRHIIFQDILKWAHVENFLLNAPQTKKYLLEISKRSASTIPPDDMLLKNFELTAISEQSFSPVGRRHPVAFSKIGSPIELSWDSTGELTFQEK